MTFDNWATYYKMQLRSWLKMKKLLAIILAVGMIFVGSGFINVSASDANNEEFPEFYLPV